MAATEGTQHGEKSMSCVKRTAATKRSITAAVLLRTFTFGAMLVANIPAQGGVVQQVAVRYADSRGVEVVDSDRIFGMTNQDIDRSLSVYIDSVRDFSAGALAGRFGHVGLHAIGIEFCPTPCMLSAKVLVGTDEIVNLLSVPARVQTQFIVDRGELVLGTEWANVNGSVK
jgi:hypothetical protein